MKRLVECLAERASEIQDPMCLVSTRHGLFVVNRHDRYIGYSLLRYGEFSEFESRTLLAVIAPGQTVVEVGANIGGHTVPMARKLGPHGRVIAVEAQPVIHQQLCANIALNGLFNVTAHQCGCGAREETLYIPPINYGADQSANFGGVSLLRNAEPNHVRIPVRPLDDIVGDAHVHLIKIDVEGMESEVIAGATRTIARCRPIMYIENDRADKSEALIRQLLALDYRLWWDAPPLFNPDNFFGVKEDDYKSVVSLNMKCLPKESGITIPDSPITDPTWHPFAPKAANSD
jgi:FkbM family methyltransferase